MIPSLGATIFHLSPKLFGSLPISDEEARKVGITGKRAS